MVTSSEIQGGKILHTTEIWEDVLDFGHRADELLCDFVQGSVINDKAFSTFIFRYSIDGSWPARVTTADDFCI